MQVHYQPLCASWRLGDGTYASAGTLGGNQPGTRICSSTGLSSTGSIQACAGREIVLRTIQRIVTGHDGNGNATVAFAGPPPRIATFDSAPGLQFMEIWETQQTPAIIDNGPDPTEGGLHLPPPRNGTRIRIVEIPPESKEESKMNAEARRRHFAEMGSPEASTNTDDSSRELMHRTETIDYGVVIEGCLTLVLEDSEVELHPGDVVVQRGTNHAWRNCGSSNALIAFILIDGKYDPAIDPRSQAEKAHG